MHGRSNLTNVLPTRELKIDLLKQTNALGLMGVSLLLTLWFFLLASVCGTLVASPFLGAVGCAVFAGTLASCVYSIAPIRYLSVLLLHEETKRFLNSVSGGGPLNSFSRGSPNRRNSTNLLGGSSNADRRSGGQTKKPLICDSSLKDGTSATRRPVARFHPEQPTAPQVHGSSSGAQQLPHVPQLPAF